MVGALGVMWLGLLAWLRDLVDLEGLNRADDSGRHLSRGEGCRPLLLLRVVQPRFGAATPPCLTKYHAIAKLNKNDSAERILKRKIVV